MGILYGGEKKAIMRNFIVYLKIIATVFTIIICVKDFLNRVKNNSCSRKIYFFKVKSKFPSEK